MNVLLGYSRRQGEFQGKPYDYYRLHLLTTDDVVVKGFAVSSARIDVSDVKDPVCFDRLIGRSILMIMSSGTTPRCIKVIQDPEDESIYEFVGGKE